MKEAILLALAFAGGWILGQSMIPVGWIPRPAARTTEPSVYRMTGEVLDLCDTMRPALMQFRQAYQDGHLTAQELWSLYQQVNRLS